MTKWRFELALVPVSLQFNPHSMCTKYVPFSNSSRGQTVKPRCQQGHVPFTGSGVESFLASSGSWWFLVFLGWRWDNSNLCLYFPMAVSPVSLRVFFYPYKDSFIAFRAYPNPLESHLDSSLNYFCKDFISKYHILRFWVDMHF